MNTQNKLLLGILIVLLLIAVGLFGPRLYKSITKTISGNNKLRIAKVRSEIRVISTALTAYNRDVGSYPSTEQGLDALWRAPKDVANWTGPYLTSPITNDPWGNAYEYSFPGTNEFYDYDLISYGQDGKKDGTGFNADIDITNVFQEESEFN